MEKAQRKSNLEDDEPGGSKKKKNRYSERRFSFGIDFFNNFIFNIRKLVKQPIKIAMITSEYVDKKSISDNGVALHVFNLCKELTKLGCETHIFTTGDKKHTVSFFENNGKLVVHRINTFPGIQTDDYLVKKNLSLMIFDAKVVNEIMKEHNNSPFDLVHSHTSYNGALMTKQLLNLKWIHTLHSIEKIRLKFMSKERRKFLKVSKWQESALSCADSIITVSETLKKLIVKNYNFNESKIFVIPNGVDSEIYKTFKKNNDKKILYIGRFSMEKGIGLLPEIIDGILSRDKEIIFEIVASLEENNMPEEMMVIRKELEELEKKYSKRLIWHKTCLSRDKISELYFGATILIQPSIYDSFPTTVLEAMLFGKPIVASNVGGISEMIGNAGVVISPKSFNFINSTIELKNNPILMEKYSRRVSERVKKYFWNKIAKQTFDFYCMLTKKRTDKNVDLSNFFENIEEENEDKNC